MTDPADLIVRLRARLSKHPGQITVDRDLIADIREAADALSRPVTEEMVGRGARVLADAIGEPVYTSETADVVRHILTAALGEPAAGHETYPGHDPAAGLLQPPTEKGGDANSDGSLDHGPDNAQPRSPDTAGGARVPNSNVAAEDCLADLLKAIDEKQVRIEGPTVVGAGDPEHGYEHWLWADEWLHYARRATADWPVREAAIRAEATAKERERCARINEARALAFERLPGKSKTPYDDEIVDTLRDVAAAIRGGGE